MVLSLFSSHVAYLRLSLAISIEDVVLFQAAIVVEVCPLSERVELFHSEYRCYESLHVQDRVQVCLCVDIIMLAIRQSVHYRPGILIAFIISFQCVNIVFLKCCE